MRANWTRWAILSLSMLGVSAMGCAAQSRSDGGGGGEGGGSSSGSGAGGVEAPKCPVDCSTVPVDGCHMSVCNNDKLQCEIVLKPKGESCDDGLFCTVGETCKDDGTCGGGAPNFCGMAGDPCNLVQCNETAKQCVLTPVPDDFTCQIEGDLCIVNAVCKSGVCQGVAKDCFFAPVPDVCHVAVCNPASGKCEPVPGNDGAVCDNAGDLCIVNKVCQNGLCEGVTPKDCSAFSNGCNNGVCNPADGSCYAEPFPPGGMCPEATDDCNVGICNANGQCLPMPANDGVACNDGNACTMGEACSAGLCTGGMMGNYVAYFTETFSNNVQGWTFAQPAGEVNEWEIGSATASPGGASYGSEDPAMDHTATLDNGIAGVDIGGYADEYEHDFHYIVSPVINTNVMGPVYLEFWRMLNSDYTPYMQNTVDVFDGTNWINIFASTSPAVLDADWTHVSYDITPYKSANMQVRFGFNIGSGGVFTVGSWNLDDVVIANAVCN